MRTGILSFLISIIILPFPAFSEIAVFPYRIDNPSTEFNEQISWEYARLLSLATLLKKGLEIYSPRDVEADFRRHALDPQGTITDEHLQLLGKTRYLDHVLLGTLYKTRRGYISESVLYSVREKRVVGKARVSAKNLYRLAEKEISDIFILHPNKRKSRKEEKPFDGVLLVDLSYYVSREWSDIREGIKSTVRAMSGDWSRDTRLYVLPFSDAYKTYLSVTPITSSPAMNLIVDKWTPRGNNREQNVANAFNVALRSIKWRRQADKVILIITNTQIRKGGVLESYALKAKGMRIRVTTLALGQVNTKGREILQDISSISRGRFFNAAYHQKAFDIKGNRTDIYMEAGRVFRSDGDPGEWREGLFDRLAGSGSRRKPRGFLDEVFLDEKKYTIHPYNMEQFYSRVHTEKLIKFYPVENNIQELLLMAGGGIDSGGVGKSALAGRVLLSDGKVSLWVQVSNKEDLDWMEKRGGYFFPLGISIRKKSSAPYGIIITPQSLITGLSQDFIPSFIQVSLADIIKRPDYYLSRGLFNPPIWFIKVKVESLNRYDRGRDIRE